MADTCDDIVRRLCITTPRSHAVSMTEDKTCTPQTFIDAPETTPVSQLSTAQPQNLRLGRV